MVYEQNFRKDFGSFDATNDFNLAQRGSVTVTPNGNREVCIYKKAANGYQLIARYDDVTSETSLGFDLPKDETEILVVNGSATQVTTVGGKVTFNGGTRAGNFDGTLGELSVRLNEGKDYTYLYYNATEATSFGNILPESSSNKDKAIDDFSLISTGEFIIYPTYWNAGIASRLGIYYYDNEGIIHKKVICGNHGYNESIQYKNNNGDWVTENTIYGGCTEVSSPPRYPWVGGYEALTTVGASEYRSKGIIINLPVGTKFGFYTPMFDDSPSNFAGTNFEETLASGEGGGANHHLNTNIYVPNNLLAPKNGCSSLGGSEHLQSKRNFGRWWFLKNGEVVEASWTQNRDLLDAHSESNLNPPDAWDKNYTLWNKDVNATENNPLKYDRHAVMFALYYDDKGDMVIGAEDCYYLSEWNASDYDLNDKMFKIYGSQPLVLNNKAQSWHLAFEDLGGSFDWDFNDVILQIDYVSGQSKARVTPIAAGGTLHSQVYFNDTDDDSNKQSLGEIHEWLGATPVAADVLYEPINASSRGVPGVRKEVNITLPTTFSIANAETEANNSSNGTSSKNILGLYIETSGNDEGTRNTIAYQGMGKAPAMLVLPTSYESGDKYLEWAWPTELTDIRTAYNTKDHKFSDWVADHTQAKDWYKHPSTRTVEAKVAGKYANGTTTAGSEYEKADYGTTISFPNKNANNDYVFDVATTFGSATSATVTLALKGVAANALKAHNGSTATSEALGEWKRMNNGGTFTTVGNGHNSGTTNVNVEGMYQITLSADDLTAIKTAGHWAITASAESEIIYIAFQ